MSYAERRGFCTLVLFIFFLDSIPTSYFAFQRNDFALVSKMFLYVFSLSDRAGEEEEGGNNV